MKCSGCENFKELILLIAKDGEEGSRLVFKYARQLSLEKGVPEGEAGLEVHIARRLAKEHDNEAQA